MSSTHMYGVVLWTDTAEKKAVIWCEDHGNLAFYSGSDQSAVDGVNLDAGDLIQFDMNEDSNLRRVCNPQLVGQSEYSGIAQHLRIESRDPAPEIRRGSRRGSIVPLDRFRERRKFAI